MSAPGTGPLSLNCIRHSATQWTVTLPELDPPLVDVADLRRETAREDLVARIRSRLPPADRGAFAQRLDDLAADLAREGKKPWEADAACDAPAEAAGFLKLFPEVRPHEAEVDGAALLDEMRTELCRLLVLPPHADAVIPVYCALSYVVDRFDVAPRLILRSPLPRCGKSRTLKAMEGACYRPLKAEGLTGPVLFRLMAACHPTYLLDECDSWFAPKNGDDSIRGIVNSGFEKPGYVFRCVGDNHEPTPFPCFGLAVLASIGKLPATVEDRGIVLPMRRRAPHEHIDRCSMSRVRGRMAAFAGRLLRWTQDHAARFVEGSAEIPEGLDDRALDVWEPLIRIAAVAGGHWPQTIANAAVALAAGRDADDAAEGDHKVRLLADLKVLFDEVPGTEWMSSKDLVARLNQLPDTPWQNWNDGKGIDAQSLAKVLRQFEVRSRDRRFADGYRGKGYRRKHLEQVWGSYLQAAAATPRQPAQDQGSSVTAGSAEPPSQEAPATLQPGQNLACRGVAGPAPKEAGAGGSDADGTGFDETMDAMVRALRERRR